MNLAVSKLEVMDRMVKDDNKGILLSTTIVDVKTVPQGKVVGFGIIEEVGKDAMSQTFGLPGEYMFLCFAVKRSEFEKTNEVLKKEKSIIEIGILPELKQ